MRSVDAQALSAQIGAYQLVEGKVVWAGPAAHRVFFNFGADCKTDFTVTIPEASWSAWPWARVIVLNLKNERGCMRGVLTWSNGSSLEAVAPAQIEGLDGA